MIGLIKKTDSFGDVSYFTIVGANESSLFDQMSELNEHAYYCDTGNEFILIGYRECDKWYTNDGKPLDGMYVLELLGGRL
jgi:hypothetical protein